MSMKMVCNRCNKVKEDGELFDHLNYITINPYKDSEYDLCPECSKLFSIFMDGGEVEEDHYKDSKPCAVVIHKLANGNYAIENAANNESIDKEDPDLCVKSHKVTCPTTGETITVPDGKPWSSVKDAVNYCSICKYESCKADEAPCKDCHGRSNWKPKESIF